LKEKHCGDKGEKARPHSGQDSADVSSTGGKLMSDSTHCKRPAADTVRLPRRFAFIGILILLTGATAIADADIRVVASIKPVDSLVSAIMAGVGEPHLIMRGASSPHTYKLRPSDADRLQNADVVFLVGEGIETALMRSVSTLAGKARLIEFAEVDGIVRRPFREGGAFELHEHEHDDEPDHDGHGHEHDQDEHENFDMHIWLDPVNAGVMTQVIAATLSEVDPANAAIYAGNAETVLQRLDALTEETTADTASIRGKPYIVFHDAYQYFEKRFGLTAVGSGVVSSERSLGVRRVMELREKILELGAACVFAEPRFDPGLVNIIIEDTPAKAGVVDPLGTNVDRGPELYFSVIRNMAASFRSCLGRGD
jgi:zinc transport system substrate-binding protein